MQYIGKWSVEFHLQWLSNFFLCNCLETLFNFFQILPAAKNYDSPSFFWGHTRRNMLVILDMDTQGMLDWNSNLVSFSYSRGNVSLKGTELQLWFKGRTNYSVKHIKIVPVEKYIIHVGLEWKCDIWGKQVTFFQNAHFLGEFSVSRAQLNLWSLHNLIFVYAFTHLIINNWESTKCQDPFQLLGKE